MVTDAQERPSVEITRMMDGAVVAQLVQLVAALGVADLVDGHRPVRRIAEQTGTDADALNRALRTLAGVGVFTEVQPGVFGLTALAVPLRSDAEDSVRELAAVRGSREHWSALGELRHSLRTGRSAFTHVYGKDFWTYLGESPEQASRFDRAMGDNIKQVHAAVVDAYDFPCTRNVVDVGGGRGDLVATLLRRHPAMRAVVYDRPHAAAEAEARFEAAGLTDRACAVEGDFFNGVPEGGDTYLLSRVLHDWNDEQATHILSNVASALPPHGRVVVIDAVVPEGDTAHPAKMMDIIMLAMHEGKERTRAEFAELFVAAGLRLTRTVHTGAQISLLVAEPG